MSGTLPAATSRNNRRTALVLFSIAAVFFFGIMLKYLLLK